MLLRIFIIVGFSLGAAHADPPIQLFSRNGRFVKNYDALVAGLQPGDVVQFTADPEGKRPHTFRILEVLTPEESRVTRARIFLIEGGKILRIHARKLSFFPKLRYGFTLDFSSAYDGLASIHSGYQELRDNGIDVVRYYSELSNPREFLVMEGLHVLFSWRDMVQNSAELAQHMAPYPAIFETAMGTGMKRFIRGTARFRGIGDLRDDQVVFAKSLLPGENQGYRWRLMDWTREHLRLNISRRDPTAGTPNVFEWDLIDSMVFADQRRGFQMEPATGKLSPPPGYSIETVRELIRLRRRQLVSPPTQLCSHFLARPTSRHTRRRIPTWPAPRRPQYWSVRPAAAIPPFQPGQD